MRMFGLSLAFAVIVSCSHPTEASPRTRLAGTWVASVLIAQDSEGMTDTFGLSVTADMIDIPIPKDSQLSAIYATRAEYTTVTALASSAHATVGLGGVEWPNARCGLTRFDYGTTLMLRLQCIALGDTSIAIEAIGRIDGSILISGAYVPPPDSVSSLGMGLSVIQVPGTAIRDCPYGPYCDAMFNLHRRP